MVDQKFTLRERTVDWGFSSKFDIEQFPAVLQDVCTEVAWKNYIQKINNGLRKFRAKKKDMVLIAMAPLTAFLTLIPWSKRQNKHHKRRNEYLRLMAREFNAKYGKKLKMNWSLEQQKMTITQHEIQAKVNNEEKKKPATSKVVVAKILKEREIDEEETIYTGTVRFYLSNKGWGFISIDEDIEFKGLTAEGRIYVSKDDIVCCSEEVGLNENSKVIFKLYKDSMGIGAYEVQNEDGTPIIFERKIGDAGKAVKAKRKKEPTSGPNEDEHQGTSLHWGNTDSSGELSETKSEPKNEVEHQGISSHWGIRDWSGELSEEWEEEEEYSREEKGTVWYCAYGSNMSRDRITRRISSHQIMDEPVAVQFMDKQLVFNKLSSGQAGFANLENKCRGPRAEAVLWPLTHYAIGLLDGFEGVPYHYQRET